VLEESEAFGSFDPAAAGLGDTAVRRIGSNEGIEKYPAVLKARVTFSRCLVKTRGT
jgi:hypothetical protein